MRIMRIDKLYYTDMSLKKEKSNDRHAQINVYENAFKNHLKIGFRLFK